MNAISCVNLKATFILEVEAKFMTYSPICTLR
jgi:hypothetical protein